MSSFFILITPVKKFGWILGGLLGYGFVHSLTMVGTRIARKGDAKALAVAQAWGRFFALFYIVVCMTAKPSWSIVPFIALGFMGASLLTALTATAKTRSGRR